MPDTTHTPAGKYPTAAKVHHLDLVAAAERLIDQLPGHRRQTVSLAREAGASLILIAMAEGDALGDHAADGVVLVQAVRGRVQALADDQTIELKPGDLVMFQPGVRHSVLASEQSVILLMVAGGDD